MNPLRLLPVLAASALAGCLSPVPLDVAPQAELEAGVVGSWRCLPAAPGPAEAPANLTITPARDRVYAAVFAAEGEEPERYEIHASVLKGGQVVNVRDLSDRGPKPWTFARYALLRPGVLEVRLAGDEALKGVEPTASALRARFERPGADPLFENYCLCVRQRKE